MNILLQILELGINEIIPIEELVARLKNIFTLNPDVKVNIQNLAAEAIQADDDTIAMIARWQADHGLPVTVPVPAPAPTPITDAPSSAAAPEATHGPTLVPSSAALPPAAELGEVGNVGEHGDLGTNTPPKPSAS